jgi:Ca-activated chloride channel family protein
MRSIYGILFGTLFIVFIQASFLDQAISFPDDPQALFNAGTELYLQDDYSKATIFLERAKKFCVQKPEADLKVKDLAEGISLNLAHSLVKAEKYQEALTEYKELYCKFKNPKAEKNIPILEKFLQQQDQDKQKKDDREQNQEQDNEQNQETKNQDLKDQDNNQDDVPKQNQDNSNKRPDNQSDQSKNNPDKKNKQDQKQKLEQQEQKDKQNKQDPNRDKKQEQIPNQPDDSINSKKQNQNKQKIANQQLLDKDELALLQAIENFDQDMMKMYAAANCGGDEEDGW